MEMCFIGAHVQESGSVSGLHISMTTAYPDDQIFLKMLSEEDAQTCIEIMKKYVPHIYSEV